MTEKPFLNMGNSPDEQSDMAHRYRLISVLVTA
jgi:hypothetical protein